MKIHTVKQGEDLIDIALQYKIDDWHELYDHEANSRLKEMRSDPMCLFPGDIVIIPDLENVSISKPTNEKHSIQIQIPKIFLQFKLLDSEDQPFKNCKYSLELDSEVIEGTTNGEGVIEEEISTRVRTLTVTVFPNPDDETEFEEFLIELGTLDPKEEVSGMQQRLSNGNLYSGNLDGEFGECSNIAVSQLIEKNEIDKQVLDDKLKDYG